MGEPGWARLFVANAENAAESPTPQCFMELAQQAAVLGDTELTIKYLDQAESVIEELSDRQPIRYTWEELGNSKHANRADKIWNYLASRFTVQEYFRDGGCGSDNPEKGPH